MMFRRKEDINKFNFKETIENIKIFIFSQKRFISAGDIFTKKTKIFNFENNENLKFLKMSTELLYKFRSSIIIMCRRKVDTNTLNFKNIIQHLKIFICLVENAFMSAGKHFYKVNQIF